MSLISFQEIIIWFKFEIMSIFYIFFQILIPREVYLSSSIDIVAYNKIFDSRPDDLNMSNYMTKKDEGAINAEENNGDGNSHNSKKEKKVINVSKNVNNSSNVENSAEQERKDSNTQPINESNVNDSIRPRIRKPILIKKLFKVSLEEKKAE